MKGVKGKTAIVTGGANGIGRAFSRRLADEGASVVIADIADGRDAVQEIEQSGGKAQVIKCDMSSGEQIAALGREVGTTLGGCDILIHNAGIYPTSLVEDMSFEEWRRVLTINLDSVFHLTKAVLPGMKAKGWGRIVSIASTVFHSGIPMQSHYSASKAGLIAFSRSLAHEVGGFGITVNAIAPGLVRTATTQAGPQSEMFEPLAQQQAIKRTETPEDLVGPMAFLASDDAAFVTGQTILVDGGWRFV